MSVDFLYQWWKWCQSLARIEHIDYRNIQTWCIYFFIFFYHSSNANYPQYVLNSIFTFFKEYETFSSQGNYIMIIHVVYVDVYFLNSYIYIWYIYDIYIYDIYIYDIYIYDIYIWYIYIYDIYIYMIHIYTYHIYIWYVYIYIWYLYIYILHTHIPVEGFATFPSGIGFIERFPPSCHPGRSRCSELADGVEKWNADDRRPAKRDVFRGTSMSHPWFMNGAWWWWWWWWGGGGGGGGGCRGGLKTPREKAVFHFPSWKTCKSFKARWFEGFHGLRTWEEYWRSICSTRWWPSRVLFYPLQFVWRSPTNPLKPSKHWPCLTACQALPREGFGRAIGTALRKLVLSKANSSFSCSKNGILLR